MMFLNGLLAGFAVLGAVPIIIHLLNKSRFKVVEWGAMEFILRTLQKNARRVQLRDLILMILRTLAIILAALALARPTLTGSGFSAFGVGGGVNAVIVLDDGMSMQARDVNDARFELARTAAKEILKSLPSGSGATVVYASDVAVAEVVEPTQDMAYLEQALDKAEAGEGGSGIDAALRQAWDILEPVGGGGAREIYLITDLQARGWPAADERGWRELIGRLEGTAGLRILVVDVGVDDTANVSVEQVVFADDIVGTDGLTTVMATLRNHGSTPASGVPVDLLIDDGSGLRSAATTVVEELDRTAQVRLEARFERGGRHKVEVRSGPDRLEADNVRRTVVDVVDRVRVLVVDGGAEGGSREGATFLRAALAPASLLDGADAEEGSSGTDRIELNVVAPAQLVGLQLDEYETIILSDVPAPSAALADGLRAYVAGGRGLITLLGSGVQAEAYNAHFVASGLLPGPIGPEPRRYTQDGDASDAGTAFSTDNLVHPIIAMFASPQTQPFLAQPRIRSAWPMTVPEVASGQPTAHAVVARLADGTPVMTASTVGRGQALAIGLGADKTWSDLPLRPVFLMLLRRSIQHVALGERPRLTVDVHEPVVQALSARDTNARVQVRHPVNRETMLTPVTRDDGRVQVEFLESNRAGYVDLSVDERTWSFAVNQPAEEGDLTRITRTEAEERLAPLQVAWLGGEDNVAARVEQARTGQEIWPWLFALAVACLIAESVLALRWAPKGA